MTTGSALRVLDVGGGDGRDAIPLAMAGHQVTILDPAPSWLEAARQRAEQTGVRERVRVVDGSLDDLSAVGGGYDLVLCHFVLHYRSELADDVRRLASLVGPGGRLSVMAPNPAGRVVMTLVREGPAAAQQELAEPGWYSHTFSQAGRKLEANDVATELERVGLQLLHRYGTRIANDLLADDSAKHDPSFYGELERLELALCDKEPFLRLGGAWQLVARRPA